MDASPADQLNTLGNDLRRSGQTVLADRVDAISRRLVENGRAESAAAEVKTAEQVAAAIARDIPERRRFNVGDVVRLKGGSRQRLNVEAFGDKNGLVDQVDVCWFAMCGELQSHTFPAELLELVPAWSDGAK